MAEKKVPQIDGAELRRRAEELLRAETTKAPPPRTEAESQRLLHELEVHRIELEMQNAELHQARDEVETALDKYTDLYDFAPVGYFTLDCNGVIRGMNLTGASLMGMERSRLLGLRFGIFVADEARLIFSEFLAKVFTSRGKEACEVTLTKAGKRPLHLHIEAVACNSGEECRVAVIDITAHMEAEEKLRKSEHRLAEAQSIAHIGSWEWDTIADERSGSDEYHRIFGVVLSTYDSCLKLVHPDDREKVNRAVQETLAHQAPYNIHYHIIRPDGFTRIIHSQGMAVTDAAGKTVRMIGTAQDVTERREMEEKLDILHSELAAHALGLEAANRDLEAFNAAVSHDLRTPLTNIHGISQVLLDHYADRIDEVGFQFLRDIYSSTLQMNDLIKTFLKFSRLSHSAVVRQTVDLSGMATQIAAEFEKASPERRDTFRIAGGITTEGDPDLLRVVLVNLLGNSWKYSARKEDAVIEFGMTELDGKPAFFVRDNGVGFDIAQSDRLFLPFHRLPNQKEFTGHGIGLATVHRIIIRHGGRIWADSEPGKGATFYFTL